MSFQRLPTHWRANRVDLTALLPLFGAAVLWIWWFLCTGEQPALENLLCVLRLTEPMYLNFKRAFLTKLAIISKSKLPTQYFGMTLPWPLNVPGEWGVQFAEWHTRLYHNNIWNNNCCHVGHKETLNTGGKAQWISRRPDHLSFHFSTYNIMSPGNVELAHFTRETACHHEMHWSLNVFISVQGHQRHNSHWLPWTGSCSTAWSKDNKSQEKVFIDFSRLQVRSGSQPFITVHKGVLLLKWKWNIFPLYYQGEVMA